MSDSRPRFSQINLIVNDMDASLAFYRLLGLDIDCEPMGGHADIELAAGLALELDTADSVSHWDSGWDGTTGASNVLGFSVPTREAVDELYERILRASYRGRQRPFDAFFGARYAIVEDPDGNGIGIMSPIDAARKVWPPLTPPPS